MSYENPLRVCYNYGGVAIGAGAVTKVFRTPKGKRGKVAFASCSPTTSMTGTTTPGKMQLGDGTTANKYLDLFLGTAGAGTAAGASVAASDFASGITGQPTTGVLYLEADTLYTVTFAVPVGTPAGVVDAMLCIEYF